MNDCEHKYLQKIDKTSFEWCCACGLLIHNIKTGGTFKQVENGIHCDFNGQTDYQNVMIPKNKEPHEHDWFRLEIDNEWCKNCGSLQVRSLISKKGLEVIYRKGIILSKIRSSRIEILKEIKL